MKNIFTFLAIIIFSTSLFAGTTGKIKGKITDKENKETLPGATIILSGTQLGATSDLNGEYYIINVPQGIYTVKITYIGFSPVSINNVHVAPDLTKEINVELTPSSLEISEVIVEAKRDLIQKDATSTLSVIESKEIQALPVQNFSQAMVLNTGFVDAKNRGGEDGGIHLRGGRTGEIGYIVDGVKVDNPLTGGIATDVSRLGISSLTVMSGTFNAEYGHAQAGIVNITTQEGSSNYAGTVRFQTDDFGNGILDNNKWFTYRKELSLSGPLFPGYDGMKFFASYDDSRSESYLNRITGPKYEATFDFDDDGKKETRTIQNNFNFGLYDTKYRATGKITTQVFEQAKLQLSTVISSRKFREYDHYFKELPLSNGNDVQESELYSGFFTHAPDNNMFYEIRYSHFETKNQHFLFDEELNGDFSRIFTPVSVNNAFSGTSNYEFAGYYGFAVPVDYAITNQMILWEDLKSSAGKILFPKGTLVTQEVKQKLADTSFTKEEKPIDKVTVKTTSSDDYVRNAKTITQTLSGTLSLQINKFNMLKFGFEYKRHRIGDSWISGINDKWNYIENPSDPNYIKPDDRHFEVVTYYFTPIQMAVFVQDKIEISDFIINVGMRFDYLDVRSPDVYQAFRQPGISSTDLKNKKVEPKKNVSPRLGLSFPIAENAKVHAAYGQFYQYPDFEFLYRRFNQNNPNYPLPDLGKGTPRVGNPNLNPETSNAYEIGGEWILTEDMVGSITMFYRDTYDYIATVQRRLGAQIYFEFQNLDYANSRGLEISIKKRLSKHFAYSISYTYSRAEGNADNASTHFDEYINESVLGTVVPKRTVTLSWDQPHTLTFISLLSYESWSISVIGQYGSGLPYTPTDARGRAVGETNSDRQPFTGTVDMRAQKSFRFDPFTLTFFTDITNVFDRRNIYRVFTSTGSPEFSLNPNASQENFHRPNFFGPKRHIELGIELGY